MAWVSGLDQKRKAGAADTPSEEAADWLFKLNDNPHDRNLVERIENWRAQDPAHEAAWNRICKAWEGLGVLAPEGAQSSAPITTRQRQSGPASVSAEGAATHRRWISGRRTLAMSAMAIAACVLILLAPAWMLRLQADHYSKAGEIRTVRLEDGSQVTLAGASAIKIAMNGERRFVELLSGEAFFDVVHKPNRPFIVAASNLNVSVLGTEFNVRQGRETTEVALLAGSVTASSVNDRQQDTMLRPGQRLQLRTSDGSTRMSDIQPDRIGSWRNHKLFVSDQTVASVAEQIGRYQSGWVSIPDRTLASKRVTGVYDLSQPERALRALVAPFGGKVIEISDYLHIMTRLN